MTELSVHTELFEGGTQALPITPFATRTSITLARAERLEKYRELLAQKPSAFNQMNDARTARSMYQRDLLRQFIKFLVRLAHPSGHPEFTTRSSPEIQSTAPNNSRLRSASS